MPERGVSTTDQKFGGGPLGLGNFNKYVKTMISNWTLSGDPEDKFLRKVEREVLVPQKIRDKAKAEKCAEEVKKFSECCAKSSIAMVYKCRTENNVLKSCLTRWYDDEEFKRICEQEYLEERSEFRRTGLRKGSRRLGVSM